MLTRYQKTQLNNINWNEWVSASSVRNYLLNDTLLDFVKTYKIKNINDLPKKLKQNCNNIITNKEKKINNFTSAIMEQGNLFEQQIYNQLQRYNIIKIGNSYESRYYDNYILTKNAMMEGYDIIYQGVLHDYKNKLYGCPDLLVRSDKVNYIFKQDLDLEKIKSPLLGDYYYIIIDIKCSTLNIASNGINIHNIDSVNAFKGQLYIYNKILNNIQGCSSNKTFIIASNYKNKNNNNFIAEVNFKDYDKKFVKLTENAIKWLKLMKSDGHNWNLLPQPSHLELYPNMCSQNDYYGIKKQLSKKCNEITSIYHCGVKHRNNCHKRNINNYMDEKCNSEILDVPKKKAKIIDQILNIERGDNLIHLDDFNKKKLNFLKNKNVYYLDFEACQELYKINGKYYINMIGVGWIMNNKWHYKNFFMKELTETEEKNIFKQFNKFIKTNSNDPLFIHWHNYEKTNYNRLKNKYNLFNYNFFDLCNFFINNSIIVKNSKNFKLKNVAKSMYMHNMITTTWDNNIINGLDAMYEMFNMYQNNNFTNLNTVIKYNEVDCKVMYDMIKYLNNKN
jgi:predicted RecB family nuclease